MIKQIVDKVYQNVQKTASPFQYRELIEQIIADIALPQYGENTDIVENVRNRIAYHDKRFQTYGNGIYGLSEWHNKNVQLRLLDEFFQIPMRPAQIMSALYESKERIRYMIDKYNHGTIQHFWNLIIGLIIEHHLKHWFATTYQESYYPPANENDYTKPCLDDWLLNINNHLIRFDAKRHVNTTDIEQYRTNKKRVFICADIDGDNIVVYGFTTSKWLNKYSPLIPKTWADGTRKNYYRITTNELYPLAQIRAYINCLKMDIDFSLTT